MPPRRSQRKNGLFDGMSPDMQDAIQVTLLYDTPHVLNTHIPENTWR